MHPAFSVLIFTVTSGAGYGLLAWLGAGQLLGFTQTLTVVTIINNILNRLNYSHAMV